MKLSRATLAAVRRALRIFGGNIYMASRVVNFNRAAFTKYALAAHKRWLRKQRRSSK